MTIIVLFHELDSDTRGYIGKYIELIDNIIQENGYIMKTPSSKQEFISLFQQKAY